MAPLWLRHVEVTQRLISQILSRVHLGMFAALFPLVFFMLPCMASSKFGLGMLRLANKIALLLRIAFVPKIVTAIIKEISWVLVLHLAEVHQLYGFYFTSTWSYHLIKLVINIWRSAMDGWVVAGRNRNKPNT